MHKIIIYTAVAHEMGLNNCELWKEKFCEMGRYKSLKREIWMDVKLCEKHQLELVDLISQTVFDFYEKNRRHK
ncbi:MAG: hypothetical protein RBG1_1C00001G1436 [candidate division Zixibacteria bacterium RBG-1]|nr:MAG: hypothetical protein RBG1_1C00001G1436 [candidate division Zixibacteria bacterium RBG-1]OGC85201.1 MAG: hypothetical protein A2V73_01200 [candidate division Zixibacteria bacterium RBG_19FT_COMBO_42_43]